MFANYHTHTARCHHATGEDKAYVEAAIQNGFQVLGFSDHCPWIFSDDYVSPIRMTPDELDGYVTSLTALKKEYAADITIYIGLESEYVPEMLPEQQKFLQDYPIDYQILGEHFLYPEQRGIYTGRPTDDAAELKNAISCGSCVLIAQAGKTTYQQMEQMTQLCERFHIAVLGCVVIE